MVSSACIDSRVWYLHHSVRRTGKGGAKNTSVCRIDHRSGAAEDRAVWSSLNLRTKREEGRQGGGGRVEETATEEEGDETLGHH